MAKMRPTVVQLDKKHEKNSEYKGELEARGIHFVYIDEMPDFLAKLMTEAEGGVTVRLDYCRDWHENYCVREVFHLHDTVTPWKEVI